jgi:translation elongation factor EF-4
LTFPGYKECRLEKISVYINDKLIEELSQICPGPLAQSRSKRMVDKLRQQIPRQQYDVAIVATLGKSKKAVARAQIKAQKKDFAGVLKGDLILSIHCPIKFVVCFIQPFHR